MSSEDLLKLLEAHGQQFLQSFDTPVVIGKRKDAVQSRSGRKQKKLKKAQEQEVAEEEWTGIGQSPSDEDENLSGSDDSLSSGDDDEGEGEDIEDDDFRYDSQAQGAQKPQTKQPDVVVFSEVGTSTVIPKKMKSGFMSSKVSKLTEDVVRSTKKSSSSDDEDDDLTNAQNDALLHRLVHTQLLSGSLNPDLNLKPAQRKKALEGRVLEAAGKAKLGKGEAIVRQAERNRAAKRVRDGLMEKQKERHEKKVEEAKQLGNYHPTLKALYDAEAAGLAKPKSKKREKGLKMGCGGGSRRVGPRKRSRKRKRGWKR
ncbi:hypothetical protein ONZ51_g584 [Trametes cubensis]|uniref:Uncharacterized protein n=1 Tax=Trametes cubensis TaxID=1111947 RepID=A0AAD7U3Q3_9APHY|nr:hypothetical protein ONZ51_g584 [Trametes cubensis]